MSCSRTHHSVSGGGRTSDPLILGLTHCTPLRIIEIHSLRKSLMVTDCKSKKCSLLILGHNLSANINKSYEILLKPVCNSHHHITADANPASRMSIVRWPRSQIYCPDNVICLLCLLHIFKGIPEHFYQGSKDYEHRSDCSNGALCSGSIFFAILAIKVFKPMREQTAIVASGGKGLDGPEARFISLNEWILRVPIIYQQIFQK